MRDLDLDNGTPYARSPGDSAMSAGALASGGRPMVAVFNPGTQRSAYTARALDENGLLTWFATGVYYDPSAEPWIVSKLPAMLRGRLRSELMRRHLPGLDPKRVRRCGFWEWVVIGAGRIPCLQWAKWPLIDIRNRAFGRRVAQWVRGDVDILYGVNSASLVAFRAGREAGTLLVYDLTTPTLPVWRDIVRTEREVAPPEWRPSGRDGYGRHDDIEAAEMQMADLIVCGSEFCADSVGRVLLPRAHVCVVPYGVDTVRFAPTPRRATDGSFVVLMVGTIRPEKGVRYLLEAVRPIANPRIRVKLVGHKEVSDEALAPYADFVTHVPHVPRVTVHEQYRDADVYVMPSLVEGSSNTVYEAMASGLPVIATRNSGSIARDGIDGFIVPPFDATAIAECILRLYEDRELRLQMAAAARARAELFTWSRYGRHLSALLRDLWQTGRV